MRPPPTRPIQYQTVSLSSEASAAAARTSAAQPTVPGQGAAGQKERHGRERQPDLLGEHPTEDDQVPVPDENIDDSVHGCAGRISG